MTLARHRGMWEATRCSQLSRLTVVVVVGAEVARTVRVVLVVAVVVVVLIRLPVVLLLPGRGLLAQAPAVRGRLTSVLVVVVVRRRPESVGQALVAVMVAQE